MKPTYGRVSRYGLVAYGSSLDQIGPIGRSVEDVTLLLSVVAGHDARDSTSLEEADLTALLLAADKRAGERRWRVGVPAEYDVEGMDPAVRGAVAATVEALEAAGHEAVPVTLKHTEYAIPTYYLIAAAEASSNLARYDGTTYGHRAAGAAGVAEMIEASRSEGFGDEVKRRIMLGTYALSSGYEQQYYEKALRVRRLIQRDFVEAFKSCDVMLHAVAPHPAFKLGEKTDDPLAMYLEDVFSVTANLAGLPAISVPADPGESPLPIGVQAVGPAGADAELVRFARELERVVAV